MGFIEKLKDGVNAFLDEKALASLEYRVRLIKREREGLKDWTDRELKLSTLAIKDELKKGKSLDSQVVPAFSIACEAARRVFGKVPYDVQILAGLVIHQGRVAEMKAGEGKTLTETMPVYLNALAGKGVHLITTNDYLAERDAKEMGKLYEFLGLTTGYVTSAMKSDQRRRAYAADITYVSNQEVGFDYLRDNLVYTREEKVLRQKEPLSFGIVDEIDSILIDESRTPLIIAEAVKEERGLYDDFMKIIDKLKEDKHYTVDYKQKQVQMTDEGLNRVEELLGQPVFSKDNPMYVFYLDVCLKAKIIFEKDRDYIITPDGIEIVDEFTGRVLPGRRFTDGVHQAIEAKEKVKVKESDRTTASITFQNFFPMYKKLSGMSGTVMRARDEFSQVYHLDVIQIPTNRPLIRVDHNDLFFKTLKGKFASLAKKVRQIHSRQQPILIGARNVETAHIISDILSEQNLPFQMLTAADHRAEAEKIAKAGQEGMITVATNMAGRGTDILLGPGVAELGGLYVLGTERHESRRIDDQLVGRSGRQGDAGESQFLISMEDEIMQLFGSEKIIDVMENFDIPEDEYVSAPTLDEAFRKAQDFVESKNYDSRIYLYKYDRVVNFQRSEVYRLRELLLENEPEFEKFMLACVRDTCRGALRLADIRLISKQLAEVFSLELSPRDLESQAGKKGWETLGRDLESYLQEKALDLKQETEVWQAAQKLILETIDTCWGGHLEFMEILKEEANLFSYASEEPLIDFIKDSRQLFADLGKKIQSQFVSSLFTHIKQQGKLD